MRPLAPLVLVAAAASCGYRPLHAVDEGAAGRLHVALVRTDVADAVAADEVLSGAREELARGGALAAGDGYPRVEIEVLRADETSEAIAAGPAGPRARATDVTLVAHAWIVPARGDAPSHDTGDVRATDIVGAEPDARADALRHEDAVRAVARRVGARLARKVLGEPAAAAD